MLLHAATRHDIDIQSWFIGDILNDVEAGCLAGCRTILSDNCNETQWQFLPVRSPHYSVADLTEVGQLITSVDIKPLIHFLPLVENTGE